MSRQLPQRLQRFDKAYNRLGCLAFLCLLGLIVVGLIVVPKLGAMAVICLEFGRDTYFKNGVRLTGHKGFRMPDGRSLSILYATLFILFQLISWARSLGHHFAPGRGRGE
jgi:hypothetical protein